MTAYIRLCDKHNLLLIQQTTYGMPAEVRFLLIFQLGVDIAVIVDAYEWDSLTSWDEMWAVELLSNQTMNWELG